MVILWILAASKPFYDTLAAEETLQLALPWQWCGPGQILLESPLQSSVSPPLDLGRTKVQNACEHKEVNMQIYYGLTRDNKCFILLIYLVGILVLLVGLFF